MIVYISGPITGKTREEVQESFRTAENDLRRAYSDEADGGRLWVINPADIAEWGLSWQTYMQIATSILQSGEIDGIYMRKGWRISRGARIEHEIAKHEGIQIGYQDPRDDILAERAARPYDAMGDDVGSGAGDSWYRENFVEKYNDQEVAR